MRNITIPSLPIVQVTLLLAFCMAGVRGASAQQRSVRPTVLQTILEEDGLLHLAGDKPAPDVSSGKRAMLQDQAWQAGFGLAGLDFRGEAVAVSGEEVFVGGQFETAGTATNAVSIARWNSATETWSALGSNTADAGVFDDFNEPGVVSALAAQGNKLYVGGAFAYVNEGDQTASNIAVWDMRTSTWSSLGTGVNGTVLAVEVSPDGRFVYVGGRFSVAGERQANRIAVWNTASRTWSNLAGGTDGDVWDIEWIDGEVYVGGAFSTAGGVTVNGVARWDGSAWLPLQEGSQRGVDQAVGALPTVFALATDGTDLFLGGDFATAGGRQARHVARWDVTGQTFSPVGSGFADTGVVYSLAMRGSTLLAAGLFSRSGGGTPMNQVAAFRGGVWEALGDGLQGNAFVERRGFIRGLAVSESDVYVAGHFTQAGTLRVRGIVRWDDDGRRWETLTPASAGNGLLGQIDYFANTLLPPLPGLGLAAASDGNAVFVGGSFQYAGAVEANSIARWDPVAEEWSALGAGVTDEDGDPGLIRAVAVRGDRVYVGGLFAEAGGVPANNVAVWNSTTETWAALGDGVDQAVRAISVTPDGNRVLVGGLFTEAGGQAIAYLGQWNVSSGSWSALADFANPIGTAAPGIRALEWVGNDLYVGGNFRQVDGQTANFVVRWDGASWLSLQDGGTNGVDEMVIDLASDGTDLYLGGVFEEAGATVANGVARWVIQGQSFTSFNNGFGDVVTTLAFDSDGVFYAGGAFLESGVGTDLNRIAYWIEDEGRWGGLGSGVDGTVWSITPLAPGDLFVTGVIRRAGGQAALGVSWYQPASNTMPVAEDDVVAVSFETPLDIDVLANDHDPDEDLLVVSAIVTETLHGSVEIVNAGTAVRYVPEAGYVGQDAFRYRISDGRGGVAEADVSLFVAEAINTPPVAQNDAAATRLDTPVDIDVLANDTDQDDNTLTIVRIVDAPAGGAAEIISGGQAVRYVPRANFAGSDTFRYRIEDGAGGQAEATVTVFVLAQTTIQVIHNAPLVGIIDLYLNGVRVVDDLGFQEATTYLDVEAGQTTVEVVDGNATDNSMPLYALTTTLAPSTSYVAIANGGGVQNFSLLLKEDAHVVSDVVGQVEFFIGHGALDVAGMDIALLDPTTNNRPGETLADGITFGQLSAYQVQAPGQYNFDVTISDVVIATYFFDWQGYGGQVLTVLASGQVTDGSFTLVGFDAQGNTILPNTVTASEIEEIPPASLIVHGNYPNPFNPTTTIVFDLPERAEVRIEVIDLMGRRVLARAPETMSAGTKRSVTIHAEGLASGAYLYRVVARTANDSWIRTGRMVLLK